MPTLIYSPGVRVLIHSTRLDSVIDVSADITNGSVTLAENSPGSFNIALANHRRKYDGIFSPNDRISIQMKRLKWMQVFAGYLSEVPYFSIYPRTIPLAGQCTLKRLRFTQWDPGAPESIKLLWPGQGLPKVDDLMDDTDGGMRARFQALLTKVGQWPEQNIHIGRIPDSWIDNMKTLYDSVKTQLAAVDAYVAGTVGTGASVAGSTPLGGGSLTVTPDPQLPQATGTIPDNGTGKASWFGGPGGGAYNNMALSGESGISPADPWYCAMHWPYVLTGPDGMPKVYLTPKEQQQALNWWKNRKILVVNPTNMKAVVLRAADWGPWGALDRVIDMSQHALETVLGASTDTTVQVRFAPEGAPLGPFTIQQLNVTGGLLGVSLDVLKQGGSGAVQDFVTLAAAQVGDEYIYGTEVNLNDPDPHAFDCSELVEWACRRVGVNFPDGTDAQWNAIFAAGTQKSVQEAAMIRGALLFHPGHVAISLGDGVHTIEAMGRQYGVVQGNIGNRFTQAGLIPGINYGAASNNAPAGGVTGGGAGATVTQLGADPTYTSGTGPNTLINTAQWQPSVTPVSEQLVGPRALLNDEPLLNTIQQYAKVSMRSFMAAPNGDFIAWFPDYFGFYGTAGRIQIEPVELLGDGFTVEWADEYLVTHQFVMGAEAPPAGEVALEGDVLEHRFLTTQGIASVEFPEILASLFNIKSNDDPRANLFLESEALLRKYGARVAQESNGNIPAGVAEFWYATYLFMRSWAQQFSARIDLTFMPELYPGMIIEIPKYHVQMYCAGVTHSFNFAGLGFTSHATITSLSATDSSGLYALPVGGKAK